MGETTIRWAATRQPDGTILPGYTFNSWIGCSKVSEGCQFCYAESQNKFYGWAPEGWGPGKARKLTSAANHKKPLAWAKAAAKAGVTRRVFGNSLNDILDPEVPQSWRDEYFELIDACGAIGGLEWLLLTKRIEHAAEMLPARWLANPPAYVRLGVTAENQRRANERIILMLKTWRGKNFVSCEPLLETIELWNLPDGSWWDKEGANCYDALAGIAFWSNGDTGLGGGPKIQWLIGGGESGSKARITPLNAVGRLRTQAQSESVPFMWKQWGEWIPEPQFGPVRDRLQRDKIIKAPYLAQEIDGTHYLRVGKTLAGHLLDGREYMEFPEANL